MFVPTYVLVLLVAVASVSAFGPPKGRVWCTCRWPKCKYGEFVLDKQCRLTPIFPWHWKTCCKWLPWWATNRNYGNGGQGGGVIGGGIGGVGGIGGGGLGGGYGGGGYGYDKKY